MIKTIQITFLIIFIIVPVISEAQKKLRREESFFGFHFDFHATNKDKELGKNFDEGLLDTFLIRTKPDYIQIDSKGHPGYSSYPTKVGYSAASFFKDPMRIWRDITNKHNIPLYVHYSGLWDDKAIPENLEWARINSDGSLDSTKAAYLGGYSDQLLIPQLKEMIDLYDIDGAWVDGDCWTTAPDYSPEVIEGFLIKSNLKEVPRNPADKNYKEWLDYNRLTFRKYLENYIDELHRYKPGFQIASNWAYSSMMPEKVDIEVDFLSGDVSGQNGLYSAAFQARCLALQGKPWDLMAWGFVPIDFMGGIHSPKSLIQLQQEAAEIMAMGGGFQVYFQQNRDASFRTLNTDAMVKLAEFCRERQPFSQNSEIIPQIGMWYSLEGWKKHNNGVYGWSSDMGGILNMLLDGQHAVEILMDHQLKERMQKYPLIVIPEWDAFNQDIKGQLLKYVENGGNLLIIGAKAAKEFEIPLAVDFVGEDTDTLINIGGEHLGGIAGIKTQWQPVAANSGTEIIGKVYRQTDYRYATKYPVATVNPYGKGKIAALYMDMSAAYNTYRNPIFNNIVNQLIEKLVPDAALEINGSNQVHVVMGKKNENTLVHLINSSGHHFNKNILSYNEVFPTPPLTAVMKAEKKPKALMLQPLGKELDFKYNGSHIEFEVPPIKVHTIIEVVH
ncbi:MAG: hypothetical protein WD555_02735 [Fulvivirga sp.]